VEYSKRARLGLAVPLQTGFVQTLSFPPNSFAVITMFHVLEHVEDPSLVLSRLSRWLTPNGLVVVEVPNVEATCQAPNHRFHSAHLYSFNTVTLEAIGKKAGLVPMDTKTSHDSANLTCVFRNINSTQGIASLPDNYRRIVKILGLHRTLSHYLGPTPYLRVVNRLQAYLANRVSIIGCKTATHVLDRLISKNRE